MAVNRTLVRQGVINGAAGRPVRASTNDNIASSLNYLYAISGGRSAGVVFDPPHEPASSSLGGGSSAGRAVNTVLLGLSCPRAAGQIQIVFAGRNIRVEAKLYRLDTAGPTLIGTTTATIAEPTFIESNTISFTVDGEDIFLDADNTTGALAHFVIVFRTARNNPGDSELYFISAAQNFLAAGDIPTDFQW